MSDLAVKIGALHLKNPVLTASGTFGYGLELGKYFDISTLGGIITKTITLEERPGNPPPRIAETSCGILNSIGLANVGVERFLAEKIDPLKDYDTAVIVNIAGSTVEEYRAVAEKIQGHARVDGLEINVSCPNVRQGGLAFGTDPDTTRRVVKAVKQTTQKPVIVKLTPNVTDITLIAEAAADGGADGLSLINTVLGMTVDIDTRRPTLGRGIGGLSGPAIKPIAIAKVHQVRQKCHLPIIGIGGILSASDALEFMITGATAVQTGTLNFIHPDGPLKIVKGLTVFCEEKGISAIREIIGTLETGINE